MKKILSIIFILVIILLFVCYLFIKGSLPLLSGNIELTGLSGTVLIQRDSFGVATIKAENRLDVAQATGFLHAQERFFQMDLLRRYAAGELSELLGFSTIELDKKQRLYGFRKIAEKSYGLLNDQEKAILTAYAKGVNQGLSFLKTKPFESIFLRTTPRQWEPIDSVLVCFTLFCDLQDGSERNVLNHGYMKKALSAKVYDFFVNNGSCWESTLDNSKRPILPVPAAEEFEKSHLNSLVLQKIDKLAASNNWAISGQYTKDNRAILACDMHLSLSVPNIWYRLGFEYPGHTIYGASLPGTPCIIIGSNKNIAWGFTNASVDTANLVIVEVDPQNPNCYLTPQGIKSFDITTEYIKVRGQKAIPYKIRSTIWGPIVENDFFGSPLSVKWVAHYPESINLQLIKLEIITSATQALKEAHKIKIPLLNFIVADKDGHIGWTLIGSIPKRRGFDDGTPISFLNENNGWDGLVEGQDYPSLLDPPKGYLWTANQRCLGKDWDWLYGLSSSSVVRAYQIESKLKTLGKATEDDMFNWQLDTEAIFFRRYQKTLLDLLEKYPTNREVFEQEIKAWDGRADLNSRGYYLLKIFVKEISKKIGKYCCEESLWQIVNQKPEYLKDPKFTSWDDELLTIVDNIIANNKIKNDVWGDHNKLQMNHPFSSKSFFLHFLLDMPNDSIAGDSYSLRVSKANFGASERMVVSPGHEEDGVFQSPGGQSGNPISKNYKDAHKYWIKGKKTKFLPGKTVNLLILHPDTNH